MLNRRCIRSLLSLTTSPPPCKPSPSLIRSRPFRIRASVTRLSTNYKTARSTCLHARTVGLRNGTPLVG